MVVALVLFVLSRVRDAEHVVVLLLLAIVLAVGLDPWVRILSRRLHLRRGLAVLAIFVLAAAALVLFAFLVIPPLVSQIAQLARSIPRIADDLAQAGGPVEDLIGGDKVLNASALPARTASKALTAGPPKAQMRCARGVCGKSQ